MRYESAINMIFFRYISRSIWETCLTPYECYFDILIQAGMTELVKVVDSSSIPRWIWNLVELPTGEIRQGSNPCPSNFFNFWRYGMNNEGHPIPSHPVQLPLILWGQVKDWLPLRLNFKPYLPYWLICLASILGLHKLASRTSSKQPSSSILTSFYPYSAVPNTERSGFTVTDPILICSHRMPTESQLYLSTRGGSVSFSFSAAVLKGLASDGGLFIPHSIPPLPADALSSWSNLSFQSLALEILSLYISPQEIPREDLKDLIDRSYSTFRVDEVTPLVGLIPDENIYLLELFHGPTYAFKDVALQFLGNLFEYFLQIENKGKSGKDRDHLTVLGATSGDTGRYILPHSFGPSLKWFSYH